MTFIAILGIIVLSIILIVALISLFLVSYLFSTAIKASRQAAKIIEKKTGIDSTGSV